MDGYNQMMARAIPNIAYEMDPAHYETESEDSEEIEAKEKPAIEEEEEEKEDGDNERFLFRMASALIKRDGPNSIVTLQKNCEEEGFDSMISKRQRRQ